MSKVVLKNERTGETLASNSFQNVSTAAQFMKMSYGERLALFRNDREMYDCLVSKLNTVEKKVALPLQWKGYSVIGKTAD